MSKPTKEALATQRWAIHIDIEGFSALWGKPEDGDKVLWALGELMRAIFRIGNQVYPNEPLRLFAYQLGDGFLIQSSFHEESLERAATIATCLMHHVASQGRLARVAIAEGENSDILGCYPREVTNTLVDGVVPLGEGLMIPFSIMGSGLISAVSVSKRGPRGPLMLIDAKNKGRLSQRWAMSPCGESSEIYSIDWVHIDSDLLKSMQNATKLSSPSAQQLKSFLLEYCRAHKGLHSEWKENVHRLLAAGEPKRPSKLRAAFLWLLSFARLGSTSIQSGRN